MTVSTFCAAMSNSWSQWFIRLVSLARELVLDGVDAMTAAVGVATKRHMNKIRMATMEAARLELQKQLKSAQDEKGEGDAPKTTADLETWPLLKVLLGGAIKSA